MSPRRSLWLLRTESVLVSGNATIPLLPPFYYSLGLTQAHLGVSEAIFALFWLTFAIPTSWVADRFSRRACNVIGNFVAAGSFFVLANATSFTGVLTAGILLAVGTTCSQGADVALLYRCCQDLKLCFTREVALQRAISPWVSIGLIAGTGLLATYNLKLALLCGGIPFAVGAVAVFFVQEGRDIRQPDKEARVTFLRQIRAPFADMRNVTRYCLKNQQLRWLILIKAMVVTLTGSIGWLATPLAIKSGVPKEFVTMGWILFVAAIGLGSWLYRQVSDQWSLQTRIFLPTWIAIGAMLVISAHVSIWTLWLFGLVGICRGWHFAMFEPLLQKEATEDIRATVSSVSSSLVIICYLGFTLLINWAGSQSVEWALIVNCVIMAPIVLAAKVRMPKTVK